MGNETSGDFPQTMNPDLQHQQQRRQMGQSGQVYQPKPRTGTSHVAPSIQPGQQASPGTSNGQSHKRISSSDPRLRQQQQQQPQFHASDNIQQIPRMSNMQHIPQHVQNLQQRPNAQQMQHMQQMQHPQYSPQSRTQGHVSAQQRQQQQQQQQIKQMKQMKAQTQTGGVVQVQSRQQSYKPATIESQHTYTDAQAKIKSQYRGQHASHGGIAGVMPHGGMTVPGAMPGQSQLGQYGQNNYITQTTYMNSHQTGHSQEYDPNYQFQRFHENMKSVNYQNAPYSHQAQISSSSSSSAMKNIDNNGRKQHSGYDDEKYDSYKNSNNYHNSGSNSSKISNNNNNSSNNGGSSQKRSQKRNKHHSSSGSANNSKQKPSSHGNAQQSGHNYNNTGDGHRSGKYHGSHSSHSSHNSHSSNHSNHSSHSSHSSSSHRDEEQQMAKDKQALQKRFDLNLTKLTQNDFTFLCCIGQGSFGKVYLVRKKYDKNDNESNESRKKVWALKILNKRQLLKAKQIEHTRTERRVLGQLKHPFLVKMRWAFQTYESLYIVMEYANGGELFYHLKRDGKFTEYRAKFYAAEILLAIAYMHSKKVIYRDLKPENVLLDRQGHIKLTDFGLSKDNVVNYKGKTYTFCGTPEYLAPEVLLQKGHGRAVDWWSLGTLLYEMMHGIPPFYDENVHKMYEKILHAPLHLPKSMSRAARDIFVSLLQRDPAKRLGSGPKDACEIQNHEFFSQEFSGKWRDLNQKNIKPPYIPSTTSESDTNMIDPAMTSQDKEPDGDGSSPQHVTNSMQQAADAFAQWTWTESQQATPLIGCEN